jgi:hypothetical protein
VIRKEMKGERKEEKEMMNRARKEEKEMMNRVEN